MCEKYCNTDKLGRVWGQAMRRRREYRTRCMLCARCFQKVTRQEFKHWPIRVRESNIYLWAWLQVQANGNARNIEWKHQKKTQYRMSVQVESIIKITKNASTWGKSSIWLLSLVTCARREVTLLSKDLLHRVYSAFDTLFPSCIMNSWDKAMTCTCTCTHKIYTSIINTLATHKGVISLTTRPELMPQLSTSGWPPSKHCNHYHPLSLKHNLPAQTTKTTYTHVHVHVHVTFLGKSHHTYMYMYKFTFISIKSTQV